jgi:hypothetical protein
MALTVTILALLYLLTLYVQYGRVGLRRLRIALVLLRLLILLLVLAAWFQPSFNLRRLQASEGAAVLIDNSASMKLAGAESAIERVTAIARRPMPDARADRPRAYLFGDSLRPWLGAGVPDFGDKRSYLPALSTAGALARSQRLLIVSDGAWSNATLPEELFQDRECWFVTLGAASATQARLGVAALADEVEALLGEEGSAAVVVEGYSHSRPRLSLACLQEGRVTSRLSLTPDSGFFRDTVALALPASTAGRGLCRVVATLDSLSASCSFIHTVIPQRFSAALYAPVPGIDRRFLALALAEAEDWRVVAPDTAVPPDLLILFGWDAAAARLLAALRPRGVALFAGCLPCESPQTLSVAGRRLLSSMDRDDLRLPWADLPPLAAVLRCGPATADTARTPSTARSQAFGGLVRPQVLVALASSAGSPADTLSVLTAAEFGRRSCLALSCRGFWRWDFWTPVLGHEQTEDYPFSRVVLRLARDQLRRNLAANLLVYPERLPVYEGGAARLLFSFPPALDWSQTAAVVCTLTNAGGRAVFDTAFGYAGLAPLHRVLVDLPPLPAGSYVYRASMRHSGRTLACADSVRIEPDPSENFVAGQNSQLLSQFCRAVSATDTAALADILWRHTSGQPRTVAQAMRVEQSWWLLLALVGLFGVEWLVRRRMRMD